MNNYILYYYLREDFSSPYYVGYGRPRRINAKHLRSNGANLLPSRNRRWIVKSGLTEDEAIELEIKHIRLWGRECDGGVLLNQSLGGRGNLGGKKTRGFTGKKHTEKTKKRISEKVSGEKNPSYGIPCNEERKEKIRKKAKERYKNGYKSPTSVTYMLVSPIGEEFKVFGELKKFCSQNKISYATMHAAILYDRKGPRRNGWSIEKI